jgi:hypothetical protein
MDIQFTSLMVLLHAGHNTSYSNLYSETWGCLPYRNTAWLKMVVLHLCHPLQTQHLPTRIEKTWTNSIMLHRDTGFSDFVHLPDLKLLKTQRFGNWICFRPQVREDIQFPKRCVFSNFESRWWTKSENPVSLCVIHHHQNPIVSTQSC